MVESKDPVSITDDPAHPTSGGPTDTSSTQNPTGNPRKDESVTERLEDEERPTTQRPA